MTRAKLSKWALAFERDNCLTVTAGRIANQTARANGETPTGTRRLSRPAYEHRQREGAEARTAWMRREGNDRSLALARDQDVMRARQAAEWEALKQAYRQEKEARWQATPSYKRIAATIKEEMKPRWRELFAKHRQEVQAFERSERGLGMLWNAVATAVRVGSAEGARAGLTAGLSRQGRMDGMVKRHRKEAEQLQAIVRDQIEYTIEKNKRYDASVAKLTLKDYLGRCTELKKMHTEQKQAMQERWRLYNDERRERMDRITASVSMRQELAQIKQVIMRRERNFMP